MMDDLIGKVLDNTYRVDKLIGSGGMGTVYKGHDVVLDRDVAIKIMHPNIATQEGFRERFLQEARAVASLEHPGIVHVLSFSRGIDPQYIVMNLIGGQNLRDLLQVFRQYGRMLQLGETLTVCALLADALAYAHKRGVYHRDIKPGNILLRPVETGILVEGGLSFQPVITDFGLAKMAEGGVHSTTGFSVGTPAYMSPEQCQGQPVDGRTDIYALGIVLYELTTGRIPFDVKTLTEAIRAHSFEAPPPPRSLCPEMPSQVEEIILKALAKEPAHRFTNASDMGSALRNARSGLPAAAPVAVKPSEPDKALVVATVTGKVSLDSPPQNDAWPTPPGELPKGGMIVVMSPDGTTHQIPVADRTLITIGRDQGSDIVLDDPRVSRRHALVSVDGQRFTLTDLKSTNGSFLGANKLLPDIAEVWKPSLVAHIGDHWLRVFLQPATQIPAIAATSSHTQVASPVRVEPIQMLLEPSRLEIRPGETGAIRVKVLNGQRQVDHFTCAIDGLPEGWITKPSNTLRLAPGDSGECSIQLHPPKDLTGQPQMTFAVKVSSQTDPGIAATSSGVLMLPGIKPIVIQDVPQPPVIKVDQVHLEASLEPDHLLVRPGEFVDFSVHVTNRYSQVIDVVVLLDNLPDTWAKLPDAPTRLEPGGAGTISIRTSPPELPSSTAGDYPFTVCVASRANPDGIVKLTGQLTVLPFYSLSMSLKPNAYNNNGRGQLVLENKGNTTERLTLPGTDTTGKVLVGIAGQVTIDAGTQRSLPLTVRVASGPPLIGTPQVLPFTIKAKNALGDFQTAQGVVTRKPILPAWSLPIVALVLVFLAWCVADAISSSSRNRNSVYIPSEPNTTPVIESTATPTRESPTRPTMVGAKAGTSRPTMTSVPANTPIPADPTPKAYSRILIPAGYFSMGHDDSTEFTNYADEYPLHPVDLDAFYIGEYEVTNWEYAQCVAAGECAEPSLKTSSTRDSYYDDPAYANYPVIWVTWFDACAYCAWAGMRLPTEAEWEKAARGDSDTRMFPWGNNEADCNRANFTTGAGYCHGDTQPVGSYPQDASPYGVKDMAGNVYEWVSDWYMVGYYSESPDYNPPGPGSGEGRVLRGGSWDAAIQYIRVIYRGGDYPDRGAQDRGFRCAQSVKP